ncbi:MAG: molybdopterin-guanine dinucleotide biosynthesis protein B [Planctomycetota bacterium]
MKAIAFVGWSGSGKTTLIEKLVPLFQRDGRRVGYLKTDAHGFTMDVQGKDTARMFDAGAPVVAILGPDEAAIRFRPLDGYKLQELLDAAYSTCDLVLVEGGKNSPLPKIELLQERPAAKEGVLALVGDLADERDLPRFDRDDVDGIAAFVEAWFAR